MKKFAICLFVLITTFLIGFCCYSFSPTGIAEAKVLSLMKELHQAEQTKDEQKLKEILADEISWSRYKDERFLTRGQVIENIKNAECEVESTEAIFIFTKVERTKVKIYFVMQQKFNYRDGSHSEHNGNYIYTFENQQDTWKLTTIHLEN